jgi:lantibiotic biosynthesis protein
MILEKTNTQLISSIEETLESHTGVLNTVGLEEGILGLSLFNYYRYLSTKDETYLHRVSSYLEQSFSYLSDSNGVRSINFLDLIEMAKYLCFLHREDIIDTTDTKEYLDVLNPHIKVFLDKKIQEKDLDAISGIIAVGHYYLEASHLTNHTIALEEIVDIIDTLSISSKNTTYWKFSFRDKENLTIETGFIHGIAGVLFFLALAFEKGIKKDTCKRLIERGARFLQEHQKDQGVNLFTFELQSGEQLFYQSLVYGDVGIGYAMYRIGNILKHQDYVDQGIHILENTLKFRDSENILIKDAELIYGASGLFALYSDLASETNNSLFKNASQYWLDKISIHSDNDTPWAGYDTYKNGFDEYIQLSFSHGVCGIGIALMSHEMGLDHRKYLTFFNYK